MNKFSLFVVSHKDINISKYPDRNIIFVGPRKDPMKEKYCGIENVYFDDQGKDNIADLNWTYCECTAMYYIYKNCKDAEYIGIEHYRRVFSNFWGTFKKQNYFIRKLKKYDIITMPKFFFFTNAYDKFSKGHGENYLIELEKIITRIAPDYLSHYQKQIRSHRTCYCNMMVMKKENYIKYCDFLFSILDEYYKTVDFPKEGYNSRMIGFIAERLLDVYINKNNLKRKGSLVYFVNRGLLN